VTPCLLASIQVLKFLFSNLLLKNVGRVQIVGGASISICHMDFKDDCPSTGPEAIGGNIALAFWWISHVLLKIYCLELPTYWMVAGTASQGV
jgi:hypothetical protein